MKFIPLSQGKFAMVDDEDFDRVSSRKWFFSSEYSPGYAQCNVCKNGKKATLGMHRFIMDAKPGQQIDHKDGNGLNNQKANLRFCSYSQNHANRGITRNKYGFKGVCFYPHVKSGRPFAAKIGSRKNIQHLGYFETAILAAKAYNDAALKRYGEFARLNQL